MEPTPLTASEQQAIVTLLDDPSPAVRRALVTRFEELAEHGRDFLRALTEGPNRVAAVHARWFLAELKIADPVSEFRSFIRSLGYELETGVLLLSRTVYPELDVTAVCQELDRIAARCRELMVEPLPVREKCRVLNRVLFHELGFRGNAADLSDPENSFIHRVLERRKGLPITLSILYLLIADRCGMRLEPVGLPGHFMVGSYTGDHTFFIDPFDRGRFLSPDELLAFLAGRKIPPLDSYLAPTTLREVLCRCCRNLARHYGAAKHLPLARLFASFVQDFEAAYEQNTRP